MASPHTINWTVEYELDGEKGLLRNDAETQRGAEDTFLRVAKSMRDGATVDLKTLKKHKTTADANKFVAEFRRAKGLDEVPSAADLRDNAARVMKPVAAADDDATV